MNAIEMETNAMNWLKKLGIHEPCGLDKLRGIELRDLARQIDYAVNKAWADGRNELRADRKNSA